MTAQILAAELGNLIQDSKRKNNELRAAAEKSLQDLKSLPQTSEAQLAADISRRPHFISPFLIACATHNAKFASTGVSCLQRLGVSRALPKERLNEVLEALKESTTSSHDVQLKILQALPALLQHYPTELRGDQLSTTLQICSGLQNAKNGAVSNTAAATLQQLVITVFDRVAAEDERALEVPIVTEVKGDDGLVPVRPAANDAYKTFNDLVLLVVGEKPLYMRISAVPPALLLELIEAILSNHAEVMTTHVEQNHLLRTLLMPLIIRSLSDRLSFPVTVRIIRILNLIIRNQLEILPSECEIALGLLNHMLDPEASQLWKRALCLEVFRGIYADSRLLLTIYTLFDATEGKKSIFGDNLAAFVRLAIEKPALIGLGQQSTAPVHLDDKVSSESAVAEAGAIAGVIGGPVMESNNTSRPFGISAQWSSMRTPCIEHLDKSDPPALPDTYVYGLVLTCITNISESLAKFVLPLTVHHEGRVRKKKGDDAVEADADASSSGPDGYRLSRTQSFRKRTIPVNPLDLTDHSAYPFVLTSSTLVTECWPAVLATCSTFLNAALDNDYYRALIRAIQKFTQVSGLLRLSTPRDAFLTTLGKVAVPSNLLMANVSSPKAQSTESTSLYSNAKGLLSVDSLVSQATSISGEGTRRPSHDASIPSLGPRNLLCLRALLNLAIALGPTLQSAWSIIFETLQVADLVMALSARNVPRSAGGAIGDSAEKLESETSAVQAAARRLFESTVDYPNESFTEMLQALCALISSSASPDNDTLKPTSSGRPQVLHQRRMGSVSGISVNTETNSRDSAFALNKLGELASLNENRLAQFDPAESGWDVLVETLIRYSTANTNATSNRLLASDILSRTLKEIAEFSIADEQREDIQARVLAALQKQISELYQQRREVGEESHSDAEVKVHQIALDALKSVIEHCGETLVAGWGAVLDSLMSVFLTKTSTVSGEAQAKLHEDGLIGEHESPTEVKVISRALARSAFATAHLVCSDFLAAVPAGCLRTLLDLLLNFSCQHDDLNMSLTAVTYFWNVADFLQSQGDLSGLPDLVGSIKHQHELSKVLASQDEVSVHVLWLQVLLDLSLITTDQRTEVRHSAIQTIGRIFESYDEQLSPGAWIICLHVILFGMVETNIVSQRKVRQARMAKEDISSWDQTTKAVLRTVSSLMTMYTERLTPSQRGDTWSALLQQLQNYFHCGSHALGTSVFDTITGVLSHTENASSLGMLPLLQTADIWNAYLDEGKEWHQESDGNQAAFVAYADAFKALYQLADHSLDEQLPSMLTKLELCVVKSDVVAYSSDIDNMTALQSRVMECLSLIKTQDTDLPSIIIQMLGRFCVLPYTTTSDQQDKRGPTFVALAKASMTLLQDIIARHSEEKDIYTSGALLSALQSLSKPIQEKYIWQREGKSPLLWQRASTTGIAVLRSTLLHLNTHLESSKILLELWGVIVDIAFYITRAQLPPAVDLPTALATDENFDIEHYKQLRDLITELLGSTTLPDSLRRAYTRNLFTTSLIHTPLPGELPDLSSAPLEDLYKIRYGQTAKLEVTPRAAMSFTCLAELIRLVAVHDSSTSGVKLAQAAAPYFILRMALPLKTYIADHPLRGRMPAPELEREELLHILVELEKLETDPQSIPNAPGVSSKHRKHLHRLYPLFIKAIRVARQDAEVGDALGRLVELVGEEFGIDD